MGQGGQGLRRRRRLKRKDETQDDPHGRRRCRPHDVDGAGAGLAEPADHAPRPLRGRRPVGSVAELIAYAKANPGKVNYGSSGPGGISHLAAELFRANTGIDIVHVPYRGAAPAVQDLLAGQVQMVVLDVSVLLPHIRSGAIKPLTVTSKTRAALLP